MAWAPPVLTQSPGSSREVRLEREDRAATAELLITTWSKDWSGNTHKNCYTLQSSMLDWVKANITSRFYAPSLHCSLLFSSFIWITSGEKMRSFKLHPALFTTAATTLLLICSKVLFLIVSLCSLVARLRAESRCLFLFSSWSLIACQSIVIEVQRSGSLDKYKSRRQVEPRASKDLGVISCMMDSQT